MLTLADVLNNARACLGPPPVSEDPDGSNHTIIGVAFGLDRVPWCAEFASEAAINAGFGWAKSASVAQWLYWGQHGYNGMQFVPHGSQRPGDFPIYGENEHMGILETSLNGTNVSIEGNWGNKVARVNHPANMAWITGYVRLPYRGVPTPPPTPTSHWPVTHLVRPGILEVPDTGQVVASLQIRLNTLVALHQLKKDPHTPAKLTVDGAFGGATKAVVEWFQGNQKLTTDGQAGPQTMAALAGVEHALGIHY